MQTHPTSTRLNAQQQVWVLRGLAVAAVVALLAISAPFVWAAASAGAGMGVLATMAAIGVATLQAIPLAMQKLENRLLAARKAEARRNPIEQLQNEVLRRAQRRSVLAARSAPQ